MSSSPLTAYFRVVTRAATWLGVLFHLLAFPLGLFYFIFLATGLSLGIGLVVIWVGIPILLLVAGAWWLFGAFERLQARFLLLADVPDAPRAWERAEGVWGKLKAHFGSPATWKDLVYLFAKLPFGIVSFWLLVSVFGFLGGLFSVPFLSIFRVTMTMPGWTGVPPWWASLLAVVVGVLLLPALLYVVAAWTWICARWSEVMLRIAPDVGAPPAGPAPTTAVTS